MALWIDPFLFLRRLLQRLQRAGSLVVLKVALLVAPKGTESVQSRLFLMSDII